MKKSYLLILFFLPLICFAQTATDGDYRSAVATGNWSAIGSWQVREAGSWAGATSLPTTTNNVYIQSGHAITVDANAFCQDFHLNSTATAAAIIVNSGITLQVNRKIRNYTGTTSTATGADGVFYTQTPATSFSTGITTTGTGKISFVFPGAITTTGEWGANITVWNAEFAIPVGQTATLGTSFKAGNISIISGTLSLGSNDLRPDGGSQNTGTLTVSTGATLKFISSGNIQRSGTSSGTSHFSTLTIDGTLEYNGSTVGAIGATTVNFNGNVVYSGNGQILVTKGSNSSGANPTTYTNLLFNGGSSTTVKTITLPTTVNGKLTFASHSTHGITFTGSGSLIYGANSTLEYAMTNSTARIIIPEWPGTGSPINVTLINTNADCGLTLPASTTRTITGALTLNAGTLTIGSGNTITMGNNSSILITTGGVTLNTGTMAMGTSASDVVNVTINGTLSSGGELQSSPVGLVNLTINSGFSYAFSSSGASNKTINNFILNGTFTDNLTQTRTLTVKGNITGTGTSNVGKTIMSLNTISSNISAATFANLELNDADGFALTGTPNITGTLSLTNGVLNNSTNNMTLSDNVQINRAAGSFSAAPVFGTTVNVNYNDVALTTTGFELPASTTVLNNLTINNAGGVTLNAPATVNGVFTLTNGVLTTSTTNKLVLAAVATTAGGSNTSHVSGPMVMNTIAVATYTFPVGKAGVYRPFSVNTATANANAYTGEYFNTDPHAISSTYITPVTGIADNEYYDIAHSTGTDAATITFTLNGAVTGGTASDRIIIAHYNSGTPGWENTAGGYLQGDATSGSITSGSLTSFSPFTFGLKPAIPLPLHFISFEALNNNGFVKLKWKTADEINVNRYVVEESINGNLFIEIKNINANNRSGTNLYSFTRPTEINNNTYFRIKIVNANGKIEYSNIILVKLATKEVTIYPNPVSNTLNISGVKNTTSYRIMNAMGQVVLMQNTTASSFSIDVANLQSGLYFIEIVSTDKTSVKQTFIKK